MHGTISPCTLGIIALTILSSYLGFRNRQVEEDYIFEPERILAFKRDDALSARETAESVKLRPILARIAWNMYCDRPMLGCGYGQYAREHVNYLADRSTDLPLERARGYIPHNVVFSLLTETGLVGLGLFAAMLFYWACDAWRLWSDVTGPLWARQQGLLLLVALGLGIIGTTLGLMQANRARDDAEAAGLRAHDWAVFPRGWGVGGFLKPCPSSSALSSSSTVIANDFSEPRISVNQRRMNLMSWSRHDVRTKSF